MSISSYQFLYHGDESQEILLNSQVERILLLEIDRDCSKQIVSFQSWVVRFNIKGPLTFQELADVFDSHERGRAGSLVLLQSTKPRTQLNGGDQVLELARPQTIVLIERVLISNSLQAEDLLLLGIDLRSRIIQDGLDCFNQISQAVIKIFFSDVPPPAS